MDLNEPVFMLKLSGSEFFNEELSCLGMAICRNFNIT